MPFNRLNKATLQVEILQLKLTSELNQRLASKPKQYTSHKMPIKTHYDNLQVTKNADHVVIKSAYKSLIQKHHPDRCFTGDKTEAELITKILNDAYQVLSDPASRKAYDKWIVEQEIIEKAKNAEKNREFEKKKQNEKTNFDTRKTTEENSIQAIRRHINNTHQRIFKPLAKSPLELLIVCSLTIQLVSQSTYSGSINRAAPGDPLSRFFYFLDETFSVVFTFDYWLSAILVFFALWLITSTLMKIFFNSVYDGKKRWALHQNVIVWTMAIITIPYIIFRS